jgi:hypothetical protein
MRTHSKLIITALAATLVFSFAVSSASASRLSVSNRNIRAVWSLLTFEAAGSVLNCPVTLEGSFHSTTLAKRVGALVGHISRASVRGSNAECLDTGTATVSALPWHVVYAGFQGTLPRPTGLNLNLVNARITIDPAGFPTACTGTTTIATPARFIAELDGGGTVIGLRPDPAAEIPLSEGFGCALFTARMSGTATVRLLGSTTTTIRVTLI